MLNFRSRRISSAINAGSMADIAFLLLIFFLVTTTIEVDKGILAKLPPWTDDIIETPLAKNRVFTVKVNAENKLLVENKLLPITNLRESAKAFITNPTKRKDMPHKPKDAIISLQNDRGTTYETYLLVYNELKGAYNDLRNEAAQKQFKTAFQYLKKSEQQQIRKQFPMVISEAEPTEYEIMN